MAHLHAFLAADSPSAILLKRGPGKVSGTFGWDRATDTFHAGQWVRHLIRHEDADLSPDGRFFIHYSDTHLHRKDFPVYLAISRAPWLKALALWGSESWIQGPGPARFFKDLDGRTKLSGWFPQPPSWDSLGFDTVEEIPATLPWNSDPEARNDSMILRRDGWRLARAARTHKENDVFEKALSHRWFLQLTRRSRSHREGNKAMRYETFSLSRPEEGEVLAMPWEWAEWDAPRQRLVWTEDCQLFAAPIHRDGPGPSRLLFDARPLGYEAVKAPY